MIIHSVQCYSYALPLKTPLPLKGKTLTQREGLLLCLRDRSGRCAWGEAAPLPGFSSLSCHDLLLPAKTIAGEAVGRSPVDISQWMPLNRSVDPSLFHAFHYAALRLHNKTVSAEQVSLPLALLLDGGADRLEDCISTGLAKGYRAFKMKVGRGSVAEELSLVKKAWSLLPDRMQLRLDANRAWDYEDALQFCNALPAKSIAFMEEPLKDWRLLPKLQEETGLPCAVDETLQDLSKLLLAPAGEQQNDAVASCRAVIEGAQVLVWKPSLSFSPAVLGIHSQAPRVLSAAYESGVGTSAILAEVAHQRKGALAAGVDTYTRLAEDLLAAPLKLSQGIADLKQAVAQGQSVDRQRLKEWWHVGR